MHIANWPFRRPAYSHPHGSIPALTSSDQIPLQRIALGNCAVIDELFRRYRSAAFRIAYRLLGQEADALDAVQDGFVKALRNLGSFQGRSSIKTWLLRIVSNAALDIGRKRKRNSRFTDGEVDDQIASPGSPSDSVLVRAELREQIETALAQLSEPQRQVFVLHSEGELVYREIADALGISIGTVMSRLFYARQKLKSLLADQTSL